MTKVRETLIANLSLYENDTFELVNLPKGKKALKNKWVYRVNTE